MVAITCPRSDGSAPVSPRSLWLVVPVHRGPSRRVLRRRRQLAVTVLVLIIVAAVAIASSAGASRTRTSRLGRAGPEEAEAVAMPATRVSQVIHIVEPGETAWSIARGWQPHGEIRSLVDRLVAQEHGRSLQPGDRLVLR